MHATVIYFTLHIGLKMIYCGSKHVAMQSKQLTVILTNRCVEGNYILISNLFSVSTRGRGKPVQITWARRSGTGPGAPYVAYAFVFLGSIRCN